MDNQAPKIGVLVVAYNAANTLTQTLDRLPQEFIQKLDHILVCDDASQDETYEIGLAYQESSPLPLTVIKHPKNLGYGGNQKNGYTWAIEHGLDIVVLLHADGQYAPEVIEELTAPLEDGSADAVFGSRIMVPGAAKAGGMPAYKYYGNRILTFAQNKIAGLNLTEWHSGYRAYRVDALSELQFLKYSDDFDFDTEIIIGLKAANKKIVEVPIPTYYGDEICHVNGIKYAKDITKDVVSYRLAEFGFGKSIWNSNFTEDPYQLKIISGSSHEILLNWLSDLPKQNILDVGCSAGEFSALLRNQGHQVTGIDLFKYDQTAVNLDQFIEADLNLGLPKECAKYDVIIAADILEHVLDPEKLLASFKSHLNPGGKVLVSIPSFTHWYPRAKVVSGKFSYDQRGLLDNGHIRFFTRKTILEMFSNTGFKVISENVSNSPIEQISVANQLVAKAVSGAAKVDRFAAKTWPTMFAYQFLYQIQPTE